MIHAVMKMLEDFTTIIHGGEVQIDDVDELTDEMKEKYFYS